MGLKEVITTIYPKIIDTPNTIWIKKITYLVALIYTQGLEGELGEYLNKAKKFRENKTQC